MNYIEADSIEIAASGLTIGCSMRPTETFHLQKNSDMQNSNICVNKSSLGMSSDAKVNKSAFFNHANTVEQMPKVGKSFNIGVKSVLNPLLCDNSQVE